MDKHHLEHNESISYHQSFMSEDPASDTAQGRSMNYLYDGGREGEPVESSNDVVACKACGFESTFVPEGMLQCDTCEKAVYCSKECKLWHWNSGGHKETCSGKPSEITTYPDISMSSISEGDGSLEMDGLFDTQKIDEKSYNKPKAPSPESQKSKAQNSLKSKSSKKSRNSAVDAPTGALGSFLSKVQPKAEPAKAANLFHLVEDEEDEEDQPRVRNIFAEDDDDESVTNEIVEHLMMNEEQSIGLSDLDESQNYLKSITEEPSQNESFVAEASWRHKKSFSRSTSQRSYVNELLPVEDATETEHSGDLLPPHPTSATTYNNALLDEEDTETSIDMLGSDPMDLEAMDDEVYGVTEATASNQSNSSLANNYDTDTPMNGAMMSQTTVYTEMTEDTHENSRLMELSEASSGGSFLLGEMGSFSSGQNSLEDFVQSVGDRQPQQQLQEAKEADTPPSRSNSGSSSRHASSLKAFRHVYQPSPVSTTSQGSKEAVKLSSSEVSQHRASLKDFRDRYDAEVMSVQSYHGNQSEPEEEPMHKRSLSMDETKHLVERTVTDDEKSEPKQSQKLNLHDQLASLRALRTGIPRTVSKPEEIDDLISQLSETPRRKKDKLATGTMIISSKMAEDVSALSSSLSCGQGQSLNGRDPQGEKASFRSHTSTTSALDPVRKQNEENLHLLDNASKEHTQLTSGADVARQHDEDGRTIHAGPQGERTIEQNATAVAEKKQPEIHAQDTSVEISPLSPPAKLPAYLKYRIKLEDPGLVESVDGSASETTGSSSSSSSFSSAVSSAQSRSTVSDTEEILQKSSYSKYRSALTANEHHASDKDSIESESSIGAPVQAQPSYLRYRQTLSTNQGDLSEKQSESSEDSVVEALEDVAQSDSSFGLVETSASSAFSGEVGVPSESATRTPPYLRYRQALASDPVTVETVPGLMSLSSLQSASQTDSEAYQNFEDSESDSDATSDLAQPIPPHAKYGNDLGPGKDVQHDPMYGNGTSSATSNDADQSNLSQEAKEFATSNSGFKSGESAKSPLYSRYRQNLAPATSDSVVSTEKEHSGSANDEGMVGSNAEKQSALHPEADQPGYMRYRESFNADPHIASSSDTEDGCVDSSSESSLIAGVSLERRSQPEAKPSVFMRYRQNLQAGNSVLTESRVPGGSETSVSQDSSKSESFDCESAQPCVVVENAAPHGYSRYRQKLVQEKTVETVHDFEISQSQSDSEASTPGFELEMSGASFKSCTLDGVEQTCATESAGYSRYRQSLASQPSASQHDMSSGDSTNYLSVGSEERTEDRANDAPSFTARRFDYHKYRQTLSSTSVQGNGATVYSDYQVRLSGGEPVSAIGLEIGQEQELSTPGSSFNNSESLTMEAEVDAMCKNDSSTTQNTKFGYGTYRDSLGVTNVESDSLVVGDLGIRNDEHAPAYKQYRQGLASAGQRGYSSISEEQKLSNENAAATRQSLKSGEKQSSSNMANDPQPNTPTEAQANESGDLRYDSMFNVSTDLTSVDKDRLAPSTDNLDGYSMESNSVDSLKTKFELLKDEFDTIIESSENLHDLNHQRPSFDHEPSKKSLAKKQHHQSTSSMFSNESLFVESDSSSNALDSNFLVAEKEKHGKEKGQMEDLVVGSEYRSESEKNLLEISAADNDNDEILKVWKQVESDRSLVEAEREVKKSMRQLVEQSEAAPETRKPSPYKDLEVRMSDSFDIESGANLDEDFTGSMGDKNTEAKEGQRRRNLYICKAIVFLVAFAIVIGVTVGLSVNQNDNTQSLRTRPPAPTRPPANATPSPSSSGTTTAPTPGVATMVPTNHPGTPPPTAPQTQVPPAKAQNTRFELWVYLQRIASDSGASLRTGATPQFAAFDWLASDAFLFDKYSTERIVQRYALGCLFYSTDGANWTNSDGWITNRDECNWYSLSSNLCDQNGVITNIDLSYNGLSGVLPNELEYLTGLQSIRISNGDPNHRIGGVLPHQLGALVHLEELIIRGHALTGPIRSELGELRQLKVLDLSMNSFSQAIPTELGSRLSQLRTLDLSMNQLTGTLPSTINLLRRIERLSVGDNQLYGEVLINGLLGSLTTLNLEKNQFHALGQEVSRIKTLETLTMYENSLTGELFTEIGRLSSLKRLILHTNNLSGEIPKEIGDMESLTELNLSFNMLSGAIPKETSRLTNLVTLDLRSNNLKAPVPEGLGKLQELQILRLEDNDISGNMPTKFCNAIEGLSLELYADCGASSFGETELSCPDSCCTHCCVDGRVCT